MHRSNYLKTKVYLLSYNHQCPALANQTLILRSLLTFNMWWNNNKYGWSPCMCLKYFVHSTTSRLSWMNNQWVMCVHRMRAFVFTSLRGMLSVFDIDEQYFIIWKGRSIRVSIFLTPGQIWNVKLKHVQSWLSALYQSWLHSISGLGLKIYCTKCFRKNRLFFCCALELRNFVHRW